MAYTLKDDDDDDDDIGQEMKIVKWVVENWQIS
jgi:hypothetical protein